ncbi:MAG: hypothetical protein NXI02_13005, partial [Rhodobacteraceae bacterium]|nr:hypothetical protein [Paracoccaceae bacterium]
LGLSRQTCNLLMHEDQGEGLTIALKALGMPEFETTTILIRMLGENTQLIDLRGLLRMHRTLSNGAAEALVGQWLLHDQGNQRTAARHSSQYQDASGRKLPVKTPLADRGANTRKKVRFAKSSEG